MREQGKRLGTHWMRIMVFLHKADANISKIRAIVCQGLQSFVGHVRRIDNDLVKPCCVTNPASSCWTTSLFNFVQWVPTSRSPLSPMISVHCSHQTPHTHTVVNFHINALLQFISQILRRRDYNKSTCAFKNNKYLTKRQ
jgi:hypothetical protein